MGGIGGRWDVANLGTTAQTVAKMVLDGATRVLAIVPYAADGWTVVLPCTTVDEASAIICFMCTELSAALNCFPTDSGNSMSSVQKSVARSVWPLHFASLRFGACWPLRAGPYAHVGRPLVSQSEMLLRSAAAQHSPAARRCCTS